MKNLIFILMALAISCTHKSELKVEKGIVVDESYTGEFDGTSTGVGMTSNGKTVITTSHIHEDEKYIVIFKCEHGDIFSIDDAHLYADLEKNDSVTIQFYEILNSDNEIVDFDFVTAEKVKL